MFELASQLIEKRLQDNWTDTPIAFDNVEYVPVVGSPFVRLTISQTTSVLKTFATYGEGMYQEFGLIIVQVFTPRNDGTHPNNVLADKIADLFRGWNSGRLFCGTTRIVRIGTEKNWHHANVMIEFYYENCLNL